MYFREEKIFFYINEFTIEAMFLPLFPLIYPRKFYFKFFVHNEVGMGGKCFLSSRIIYFLQIFLLIKNYLLSEARWIIEFLLINLIKMEIFQHVNRYSFYWKLIKFRQVKDICRFLVDPYLIILKFSRYLVFIHIFVNFFNYWRKFWTIFKCWKIFIKIY